MPTARVADALRTLARDPAPPADGDLLARFADRRDEAAFAELIRRHGPTVLGVCRRVLGHAQDAEDAFQAVWLVLARRAADVRPPGAVGGFLYGVAVRTATKARTMALKRRLRERATVRPEAAPPVSPDPIDARDLAAVLDAEVAALPDKYRVAVVLCDVAGKSRSAAAADLGWPEGTVAARVAKGRALLADRLRRRGVTLSAAALAAALDPAATAAPVPAALAAEALAAAVGWAAAAPGATLLAETVMRTLTAARWKLPTAGLIVCGLVTGVTLAGRLDPTDPPPPPAAKAAPPPATKPPAPPPPEWQEAAVLDTPGWLGGSVAYSPDGKTLLVGGTGGHVRAYDAATRKPVWDYTDEGGAFAAVAYARDGDPVAVTIKDGVRLLSPKPSNLVGTKLYVTKTLTEPGSAPTAVAVCPDQVIEKDGAKATFRRVVFADARGTVVKAWLSESVEPSTTRIDVTAGKAPADPFAVPLAVDPKGGRVVVTGPVDRATGKNVLWVWSAGSGQANQVLDGHHAMPTAAAWSADGSTVATGDADGTVIVWDAATFKPRSRAERLGRVAAVALTADGKQVAAAATSEGRVFRPGAPQIYTTEVYVWDTAVPRASPTPIATPREGGPAPFRGHAGLAFAPDGKSLAAAFADVGKLGNLGVLVGKVRVWTLGAAEKPAPAPEKPQPAKQEWREAAVLRDHNGPVRAVAVSPNGHRFASAGADGKVIVWDSDRLAKSYEIGIAPNPDPVLAFSPDGGHFLATTGAGYVVRRADDGREVAERRKTDPVPTALAFAPEGDVFGYSDGDAIELKSLRQITAVPKEGPPPPVKLPARRPAGVVWSPDGKRVSYLVSNRPGVGRDGTFISTAMAGGKLLRPVRSGHADLPTAVAASADGRVVATGGNDGLVILRDGYTLDEIRRVPTESGGVRGAVRCVAVSADGKTVVAGFSFAPTTRTVRQPARHVVGLWDVVTGESVAWLGESTGPPFTSVAFAPDGRTLVAARGGPDSAGPAGVGAETGAVVVWRLDPAK